MKKHLLKLLLLCCVGILALGMSACVPSTEQYKVDFLVDGEVFDSCVTNGNSRIVPPSNPSKHGYIFQGWYFDEGEWTKEFHAYSFEKNPIKSDTKIYAYFKYDDTHVCDKQWTTETKATCKNEGRKVLKCTVKDCGKVYDTEILPVTTEHTSGTYSVKENIVPATCVKDGSYTEMFYCKLCNTKISETPGKINKDINAHDYSNGELRLEDGVFCFQATCGNSGCSFKVALSDVEATEVIISAATCDTDGVRKYVCTLYGQEFSTVSETVPAYGHKLCGVAINSDTVYSEITHSDLFAHITYVANQAECGEQITGVFMCENCNEYHEIKVLKPHTGAWVNVSAASCFAPGKQTLDFCSACGGTNLERATLPTGNHSEGELTLRKFGEKFNVITPCVNEADGCVHYEIVLEDVEVTSKEIIGTDCAVADVIRYTYKSSGKTLTYDEIIAEGCFIGSVRASTLQDEEGWFDYRLVGKGITLFDNTPLVCDTMTYGMYTCSSCGFDTLVDVYRPHTGSWVTINPATCTAEGSASFDCNFCDYTATKVLEITEHVFEYTLDTVKLADSNVAKFVLVGKCVCGEENIIRDVTVSVSSTTQPTCTEEGKIVYSCTYNGKVYNKEDSISKISHSLNGVPTDEGTRLDYYENVLNGNVKVNFNNPISVTCVLDASDDTFDVNGTYACSECGASVNVKIYRVHKTNEVVNYGTSSSPCVVVGEKYYDCTYSDCEYKSAVESFAIADHKLSATVDQKADGSYTVKVDCSVDGCNYTCTYAGLASVNYTVTVVADCCTDGIAEIVFVYGGTTYTVEANLGKGNHVLNGVDYTTLLESGKLPEGVTEIIIVGSKAYFTCEECGQLVEVNI